MKERSTLQVTSFTEAIKDFFPHPMMRQGAGVEHSSRRNDVGNALPSARIDREPTGNVPDALHLNQAEGSELPPEGFSHPRYAEQTARHGTGEVPHSNSFERAPLGGR